MSHRAERITQKTAWRFGFTALLAVTMAVAIFGNPGLGILARFLIDDLGLTRTQIGWLSTGLSLSAALLGPHAGRYADRIGARSMLVLVFSIAAAGYLAISIAPTFLLLIPAVLFSGIGQSGSNPATNKLIGLHVPAGRRGIVTGIKQSGVQMGVFVGGLTMPAMALAWGWRVAMSTVVIVALLGVLATIYIVPPDPPIPEQARARGGGGQTPGSIRWLAGEGLLMGVAMAAILTFLPLYAEESAGMSVTTAGLVASAYAISGLISRLMWAHFAERTSHFSRPLLLIAAVSTSGIGMLWLAQEAGAWLVWIGAVIMGTSQAFNSVAMLAVINTVDQHDAGRATGVVARGFGIGLATGPPIFGFAVDTLGGYGVAFAIMIGFGIAAAALMVIWGRRMESGGATW